MLQTEASLPVMLSRFHMKRDAEGGKWGTATLTLKVGDDFELLSPLEEGRQLMKSNTAFDELSIETKMEGVRLEFRNGVGKGARTILVPKELFGFVFRRESSTQAGTLKKDRGVGVDLDFKFTVSLAASGMWAIENLGNMLDLTIFQTQATLPLKRGEADNPDSQEARNKRIIEAALGDPPSTQETIPGLPDAGLPSGTNESEKPKARGRKKKAKKD